jgi:hypothetical protein
MNSTAKNGTTNRGGAPLANKNRMTHGQRGWLVTGSLPKGASWIRRVVGEFRRQIESAVLALHGEVTPYASAVAQSATRHEARALLAGRWLKQQGESLSLSERLQLLATIGTATDSRDKCLERLGLNRSPATKSPWEEAMRMQRIEHDQTDVPGPDAKDDDSEAVNRLHPNGENE